MKSASVNGTVSQVSVQPDTAAPDSKNTRVSQSSLAAPCGQGVTRRRGGGGGGGGSEVQHDTMVWGWYWWVRL